jgi:hypothetical protein
MDLSFLRRAEQRFASRTAAQPDFRMLSAMLRAQAGASAASQAQAQSLAAEPAEVLDPIAEVLVAGPCWRAAVTALGGSFNPAFARKRAVN